MFTLYWIALTQTIKPYRIELLFINKNGVFGAISVKERSCAAPISEVDRHISDRLLLFRLVNRYSDRSGSKWVGARTSTHWDGSRYSEVRTEIKCTRPSRPTTLHNSAWYYVRCVWTTCSSSVPLPFKLYRIAFHVESKSCPAGIV